MKVCWIFFWCDKKEGNILYILRHLFDSSGVCFKFSFLVLKYIHTDRIIHQYLHKYSKYIIPCVIVWGSEINFIIALIYCVRIRLYFGIKFTYTWREKNRKESLSLTIADRVCACAYMWVYSKSAASLCPPNSISIYDTIRFWSKSSIELWTELNCKRKKCVCSVKQSAVVALCEVIHRCSSSTPLVPAAPSYYTIYLCCM